MDVHGLGITAKNEITITLADTIVDVNKAKWFTYLIAEHGFAVTDSLTSALVYTKTGFPTATAEKVEELKKWKNSGKSIINKMVEELVTETLLILSSSKRLDWILGNNLATMLSEIQFYLYLYAVCSLCCGIQN